MSCLELASWGRDARDPAEVDWDRTRRGVRDCRVDNIDALDWLNDGEDDSARVTPDMSAAALIIGTARRVRWNGMERELQGKGRGDRLCIFMRKAGDCC